MVLNIENGIEMIGSANNVGGKLIGSEITNNTMSSPFFPNFYSRDFSVEHIFRCNNESKDNCRLELTFSDFQIAFASIMEVSV